MSPAESTTLHVLHVSAAIGLVCSVFSAAAGSPGNRRRILMGSGIASLVVLLTGIRLWQSLYHFSGGWAVVKLLCWLALSAFAGLAYKRRERPGRWTGLALILAFVAVVMVYARPF